jgi:hypothetical protein
MPKYRVEIERVVTTTSRGTIEVEAENQSDARFQAGLVAKADPTPDLELIGESDVWKIIEVEAAKAEPAARAAE